MKWGGTGALLLLVAVFAVLGTLCRHLGDNDEDPIRDAIRQAAAATGIETQDLEIESVTVRGDRAMAIITFTENGDSVRAAVVLEKVDGHWSTDPSQWGPDETAAD